MDKLNFLKALVKKENRQKLIIVIGLAAMLLLLLSESMDGCGKETAAEQRESSAFDSAEYCVRLEQRLSQMLSCIDGAGNAYVMITLQGGERQVYALEESTSSDAVQSGAETSDSEEKESRVIIIDGEDGEQPLVVTTLYPPIGGVLVVCDGAEDPEVCRRITDAVTTVLGISSKRVCISTLSKTE